MSSVTNTVRNSVFAFDCLTNKTDRPELTVVSPRSAKEILMMVEVVLANTLVDRCSSRIPSLRSQYSPPPSHPCAHILDTFST
ncbi:hypothetical protein SeLEV6574_g01775 [Synchytrium endobioticum]|uniref:Uncharacterized protein n=1 Tax=Synchytrium endobioticum TaxID=286115 RepID=A0A507DBR1_9FUNG|nr:hypothetical protein SeLEV6574_g01775 [Synchytrium endobioticum]